MPDKQLPGMEDDAASVLRKELREWFDEHHRDLDAATIGKAIEYGGADLRIMGAAMRELAQGEKWTPTEIDEQEMAIGFYLLGKVSRLFGAWSKGRAPSADTWVDTEVYSQMAQRIREEGYWT